MPDARAHHRNARCLPRLLIALFATLAVSATGCAWYSWTPRPKLSDPDGEQGFANVLALGERHADELHCNAGDCKDWFRITVDRPGVLDVVVTIPPQATSASVRLVMKGPAQGPAQQTAWGDPPPLRVRTDAVPAPYFAYVEGDGEALRFEILATLTEPTAATE
jgi:hypothetical protein